MISFNYNTQFKLPIEKEIQEWISNVIQSENFKEGEISYIFCEDDELIKINKEYLDHNTYTDIISFDYSVGKKLHGDIFISIERVYDNAKTFKQNFFTELYRVVIHGVLHYCGYKDKSEEDAQLMRQKEDFYLNKLKLN